MRARTLWLLSLVVTSLVVATAVLAGPAPHRVIQAEAVPLTSRALVTQPCAERALAVLRDWDRRRARAWARGDPAALTRLYVVGSRTARRDRAMLAAYRARGLRVGSMGRQVLRVHLLTCHTRRISILLTDRLVDAVAVGHGHRTGLPAGRPVTRRVDLRREAGSWRVREVYAR
jgi:hypothetical protein